MSDTPETDAAEYYNFNTINFIETDFARKLERERDEARRDLVASEELHRRRFGTLKAEFEQVMRERNEARRELFEIISCIEQAVDFHQVHHQSFQASAIRNLLENINKRRKRNE